MTQNTFEKTRLINFSDAVFSIAMTILVLEIPIPATRSILKYGTARVLESLIPDFIGFFVSFLVIALYWVVHNRLFQFVHEVQDRLVWLNILFLFFVILLPFSTAFYVNGFDLVGPFVFYCFNVAMLSVVIYLLVGNIFSSYTDKESKYKIIANWEDSRALLTALIWALAAVLANFNLLLSKVIFILIFILQVFINRHYTKKLKQLEIRNVEAN